MRVPLYFRFGEGLKKKPAAASAGRSLPSPRRRRGGGQTRSGGATSAKTKKTRAAARVALPLAHRGRGGAAASGASGKKGDAASGAARRRKRRAAEARQERTITDSDAQHFAKHSPLNEGFCCRCDFHRRRKVYEAVSRLPNGSSWLAAGEHRGQWGLGCRVCAQAAAAGRRICATFTDCRGRPQADARFSKFAYFKVRPDLGHRALFQVEQHQLSAAHRRLVAGVPRIAPRRFCAEFSRNNNSLPLACEKNCSFIRKGGGRQGGGRRRASAGKCAVGRGMEGCLGDAL